MQLGLRVGVCLARGGHIARVIVGIQRHGHKPLAGDERYARIDGLGCFGQRIVLAVRGHQRVAVAVIIQRFQRLGGIHAAHGGQIAQLHAVRQRQHRQQDGRRQRAKQDEGRALAQAAAAFIRDCAKERQHEQRQHVIQRHDDTAVGLRHAKLIGQDLGDDGVVCLPERADEKEREPDKQRAAVIELHETTSGQSMMVSCDIIPHRGEFVSC